MQNKDFTLIMNRLKDSFHPALLPLASSISIFRSLCSPRVAARRLICPASRLINACRRTRYPQMPFSLFSAWHCLLDHKVFCKIKKLQKHIALQTPLKTTKKQKSLSCSPVPLYPSSFTAKQKPQFQRAEYFSWACFKGAKSTGHHFNDVYLCFFFNFDAQFVRWGLHVHQGCTRLL